MTDPMHQLLDKMQNLMGKHRDAPGMHETEAVSTPATENTPEVIPFPVLTDIVRRGEFIADAPSLGPQADPDLVNEDSTGEMLPIPESFTHIEQDEPYPAIATPVLTDIVWRSETCPDITADESQIKSDFMRDNADAFEAVQPIAPEFSTPEGLQDDALPTPEEEVHLTVLSDEASNPPALIEAPFTSVEITHLTTPIEDHAKPFNSPEQAELLATSVATHVLGMIDGHLMHEVNTVVAQRLRRVVDDTLSALLTQLALDMESLVQEAVAEELARHGIHPANTTENPSNPV